MTAVSSPPSNCCELTRRSTLPIKAIPPMFEAVSIGGRQPNRPEHVDRIVEVNDVEPIEQKKHSQGNQKDSPKQMPVRRVSSMRSHFVVPQRYCTKPSQARRRVFGEWRRGIGKRRTQI